MFKNAKQIKWITIPEDRFPTVRRHANALIAIATALYLAAWLVRPFALPKWPTFIAILALYLTAIIPLMYIARHRIGLKWTQQPALPRPLGFHFHIGMNGSSFLVPQVAVSVMFPGAMGTAWLAGAPIAALGYTLISLRAMTREPSPPACPDCAYLLDGLTFPARCPECAREVLDENTAATHIQHRHPKLIALGVTCLVAAVVILAGSMFRPAILTRNLPFTARFALAASDEAAFNTIDTTKLTPDQRSDLIDNILSARLRAAQTDDFIIQFDQLDWVASEFIAGNLTPEQVHRLIAEGFQLSVIARAVEGDTIRVGEPVEISIFAEFPRHGYGHYHTPKFFAGFIINNQPPILVGSQRLGHNLISMSFQRRDDSRQRFPELAESEETPTLIITPEDTTPIRIRVRLVTAAVPLNRTIHAITWNPDATYTITPTPLAEASFEAETTITPAPATP